jgi:acetyl esterase/lipase
MPDTFRAIWTALLTGVLLMCDPPANAQLLTFSEVMKHPAPRADARIAYGVDPLQFGDLWLPAARTDGKPHPVVVLVHGGCWLASLPGVELTHYLADGIRGAGLAVWEIEYRRVGHAGGGYPGTFLDVANATDFLRDIADRHQLDLTRVIATGHSAGGHLALWLAARPKLPAGSPLRTAAPLPIHAVIGVAAIGDLAYFAKAGAHACGDDTVELLVDQRKRTSTDKSAPFRDTSPSELLPIGVKQVMIHGMYDGIVPPALGMRHQTQAKAKGEAVELVVLPDSGHFELISPWTEPGKAVVRALRNVLAQ